VKRKTVIWLVVLLAIVLAALYAYREYSRTNADLSRVRPDVRIPALQLVSEFERNDSLANQKYLGKIIELEGPLKELEKTGDGHFVLVLGNEGSMSSVRCSMDSAHTDRINSPAPGTLVVIRGACTGFRKNELLGENLGSDVELNRCVLIPKK
jgi:hypothetical protein